MGHAGLDQGRHSRGAFVPVEPLVEGERVYEGAVAHLQRRIGLDVLPAGGADLARAALGLGLAPFGDLLDMGDAGLMRGVDLALVFVADDERLRWRRPLGDRDATAASDESAAMVKVMNERNGCSPRVATAP